MDTQWLPVYISLITPVATLAIVMVGFLYNNGRMTDLRMHVDARIEDFNGRMGELSKRLDDRIDELNNRMGELSKRLDDRIDDLRDVLRAEMAKNHSEMLHRFADLDTRLTRIESRLNMK